MGGLIRRWQRLSKCKKVLIVIAALFTALVVAAALSPSPDVDGEAAIEKAEATAFAASTAVAVAKSEATAGAALAVTPTATPLPTSSRSQGAESVSPTQVVMAKPAPTATLVPRATWTPTPTITPIPTHTPSPVDAYPVVDDDTAVQLMWAELMFSVPGVVDAELNFDKDEVYVFITVGTGFDVRGAWRTGDNMIRQTMLLLNDGTPGQFLPQTRYHYFLGFYYPGDLDPFIAGEKAKPWKATRWEGP